MMTMTIIMIMTGLFIMPMWIENQICTKQNIIEIEDFEDVGHFCTMTPGGILVGYSLKPVGSLPLQAFPNPEQPPLVICLPLL